MAALAPCIMMQLTQEGICNQELRFGNPIPEQAHRGTGEQCAASFTGTGEQCGSSFNIKACILNSRRADDASRQKRLALQCEKKQARRDSALALLTMLMIQRSRILRIHSQHIVHAHEN